ncbi:MAG: hypothetical protein V7641_2063, partial [Blastocatellia bacterium]
VDDFQSGATTEGRPYMMINDFATALARHDSLTASDGAT